MITFRTALHNIKAGVEIVEILLDGQVVAVVYPEDEDGIKVVSAHFAIQSLNNGFNNRPPVPSIDVVFRPRRYTIRDGKLVYLD